MPSKILRWILAAAFAGALFIGASTASAQGPVAPDRPGPAYYRAGWRARRLKRLRWERREAREVAYHRHHRRHRRHRPWVL